MNIRIAFSTILTLLVAALCFCIYFARRSHKTIGRSVAWLDAAIIPPLIGNLIIMGSHVKELTAVGCYIYFIGMDVVILALMNFASAYCRVAGQKRRHKTPLVNYILLGADTIQMLLNLVFGHAFDLEVTDVQGQPYYMVVPKLGQTIHRVVIYAIFFAIILIFTVMVVKTPRVFREKYVIILISMVAVGIWQTFYIFSRTPVDRSMIGYGVFGLLVYFFSLHYRPLRLLDRMLSDIVSEMPEAMFVYDPTGKCVWANEQALELTGLRDTELDDVNNRLTAMFGTLEYRNENISFCSEIGTGEDKRYYSIDKRITFDSKGGIMGAVISIRDTTSEQQKLKQELYNATHDKLTGLYTREHLYSCIMQRCDKISSEPHLIVFVDIKNFKIVNDIFGTAFGDHAIRCIADMIRSDMSENCVYGRLAGDTFGVLIPESEFDRERIETKLSQFVVRDGTTEHRVLIHLGIYEVTESGLDVSVMFDRAHLALSTINDQYTTHIAFYDNKIRENVLWSQTISAELGKAISEMQLRPFLQPIADKDGNIVGAEALARWIHPERGFMSPALFIPVFEKNGMIVDVDKHMWRCACEILSRWDNDMFISVNISPRNFYFTDVAGSIRALVEEYGIKPSRLRIEITESVMMTDADERMKVLDELRSEGFIVEMDDFGSGYSSLNLLKTMPVDVLKIDMMFLSRSDRSNRTQTIIRNVIRLSGELGIASLTEGVETREQYETLSEMGCDLFQGYYFAKPLPVEEFESSYLHPAHS